jgi:hypothetical protein
MLRKTLIAAALLAASTGAVAHNDYVYGRVVTVEPHFVLSFSSGRYQDGFRILYESDGRHYWTHSHHHPGHAIWVPRPVGHYAHHHKHHYRDDWDDRRDGGRDHRGTWDRHERHDRH